MTGEPTFETLLWRTATGVWIGVAAAAILLTLREIHHHRQR